MTRDRSLFLVWLAGIGAFFLAYGVASGIGFDLWTSGRLVFRSGPPRLEPTLSVGAFAGMFVGFRLGGWRGGLGSVAFALIGLIGGLGYFVPYVQCAAGDANVCRYLLDLDFVIPQLWLVPGFVLGVFAALVLRPRIPFRSGLEAAGVFALAGPIRYALGRLVLPYVPFFHSPNSGLVHLDVLTALDIATVLAGALLASILVLRRATRPRRAGFVLATAIAILAVPQLTYQLRYPVNDTLELTQRLSFFLAAALILVVTAGWGLMTNAHVAPPGDRAPRPAL